jgi:hypothetical protein
MIHPTTPGKTTPAATLLADLAARAEHDAHDDEPMTYAPVVTAADVRSDLYALYTYATWLLTLLPAEAVQANEPWLDSRVADIHAIAARHGFTGAGR